MTLLAPAGLAQQADPMARSALVNPIDNVGGPTLAALDLGAVAQEDAQRDQQGLAPRYAIPQAVSYEPFSSGTWEALDGDLQMWRLRIRAYGAESINLGFTSFQMPENGRLFFYSSDLSRVVGPFTALDNASHGELWTPPIAADDVIVEVTVPLDELQDVKLHLTHVGQGYRGFGATGGSFSSGSCNVDVVCSQGDAWQNEIPSVGVISTGGSTFCTGFMVNNTSNDLTPYFMTANHCGIGSGNAASLVVFWNYETTPCGGTPNGTLNEFNTGSFFRASSATSDFTLVELDSDPPAASNITFSGWDATGADATSAVAIHHPQTDEKRISFENQPTTTTTYLQNAVPGDGTHVRVTDWDVGTTEPGSSGSPLYDQNHRVIGQLHGGFASCSSQTSDWYGKFSVSWTGGGTSSTRLSNWLDPTNTGQLVTNSLGNGMSVTASAPSTHEGPVGGPFTNPTVTYTLTNVTTSSLNYQVSLTGSLGLLLDGGTSAVSGTLTANGGTAMVVVTLGAGINGLSAGQFEEDIDFADQTNLITQPRTHTFEIGRVTAASFDMDSDPGWTMQGQWAHGVPTGNGGTAHGNADPSSGATGSNVLGYNLAGDYPDNLTPQHLTSTAINLTGVTGAELRFQRWLNVEQPAFDHADIDVSTDGVNFTEIWTNSAEVADAAWTEQSFDISTMADNQPTVFLRFTMGSTDSSFRYSGWNLDDIEIVGFPSNDTSFYCTAKTTSQGCVPFMTTGGAGSPSVSDTNPFNLRGEDHAVDEGGLLVYGFTKGNLNFHGGKLCIKAPLNRTAGKASKSKSPVACVGPATIGRLIMNFNARIQNSTDPLLTIGQEVFGQWLQRDNANTIGGFGDNSSNGVRFTILP